MKFLLFLFFLTANAGVAQTTPATAPGQLSAIVAAWQTFDEAESPRQPTAQTANPLGSYAEADFKRRADFAATQLQKLNALDGNTLLPEDRVTHDLLRFVLDNEVAEYRFKTHLNPILADDGFHISFARQSSTRPGNVAEAEAYLHKLRAFPQYVRQHLALMRRGLTLGIAQPKIILEGYESTYDPHIVKNVEESIFWMPMERLPATLTATDTVRLRTAARRVIQDSVVAGYRLVKTFFDTEYLPNAPTKTGVSNWPDGVAYYEQRVRYYTTQNLTAQAVHDLGLREVTRIRAEMDTLIRKTGFTGTFAGFLAFLRTDPRFYPKTAKDLLKEAAYLAKEAEAQLPAFFGKLPRQPFGVAPVPDYLAPKYTIGRYNGASIRSRNAGFYWVNTYNLKSRPLYVLESLTLHEAVPGHHLQTSLTQELTHLPKFRQSLYVNAFGEGWALYAERLGREMGFYQDPYSDFGRLTYEMWRACRLVTDTGLHVFGWSRDRAIQYMADNTALSLHECRTETDRYIAWPGQALSYKIGELKIRELRRKAEIILGPKFDIRAFHDALLAQGTVTMPVLETIVDDFIQTMAKP